MSKRKDCWKDYNWARDRRKEPIVLDEPEPEYITEIGEETYETEVIEAINRRLTRDHS